MAPSAFPWRSFKPNLPSYGTALSISTDAWRMGSDDDAVGYLHRSRVCSANKQCPNAHNNTTSMLKIPIRPAAGVAAATLGISVMTTCSVLYIIRSFHYLIPPLFDAATN
jgi:hypothetical protein